MRIPKLIPALLALFVVANAGASAWAADVSEPAYSPAQLQLVHQANNWGYGDGSGPYEYGGSYYYRRGYYGSGYYGSGSYDGYDSNDCED